ncbi:response regulator transcription factor [bacterium]|nr:response regulator transcription factor [bacterium]
MKIRCLIVDDEPLARRIIEKYIATLPAFELSGQCSSAIEAAGFLQQNNIDLIFLDIQMPELTGLDFLKTLQHPPKVILTTAYSEYALEGYEYDVMDYLLKPIPFPRFLKAVNKHPLLQLENAPRVATANKSESEYVMIESDKKTYRLKNNEIDYMEAYGNFIKIWSVKGMILTAGPMKEMECRLPSGCYIRIHKSFIVRIDAIRQLEGNMVRLKNKTLPVGRAYKMKLEEALKA